LEPHKEADNYWYSLVQYVTECDESLEELANSTSIDRWQYLAAERLLQGLIEASIGAAKQLIKGSGKTVPANAYDAFVKLRDLNLIDDAVLDSMRRAIGLRNVIVHDYLNVDRKIVEDVVRKRFFRKATEFVHLASSQVYNLGP
jgi:uncharacterized protein YutE (UPF0331/DUF86 family)